MTHFPHQVCLRNRGEMAGVSREGCGRARTGDLSHFGRVERSLCSLSADAQRVECYELGGHMEAEGKERELGCDKTQALQAGAGAGAAPCVQASRLLPRSRSLPPRPAPSRRLCQQQVPPQSACRSRPGESRCQQGPGQPPGLGRPVQSRLLRTRASCPGHRSRPPAQPCAREVGRGRVPPLIPGICLAWIAFHLGK